MAFPGIDGIRQTFAQLPELSDATIAEAMKRTEKTLPDDKKPALGEALNVAFTNYFRSRLWQLWAAKAPASHTARELSIVAKAADKLVKLLGVTAGPDQMPKLLQLILARESDSYAEKIGGYPDLPPLEFRAARTDSGKVVMRKDYQGDVKVNECIECVLLLQALLHNAQAYERAKVEKGKTPKRHEGDNVMPVLFNTLNGIWFDFFDEIPGSSWNAYTNQAGGPYIDFLVTIFRALEGAFPAPIRKEYPKLAKGLPTTPHAVRARFRASGIPKLNRLAALMA